MMETSLAPPGVQRELFRYTPIAGHRDEAVLDSGFPRRHWRTVLTAVGRIGPQQLKQRWHASRHLIQTYGITYNVGGDSLASEQLWPMDPIPLVISEAEWALIESAVVQRATLLNALLLDLYGPQRLLRDRLLPAALLYANPHFLRACFGIAPAGGVQLYTYAVDLGRSPDGRWWVISDRTQAPSGMGYTLQNRLVSARTLPNVFDQCQVRQLARFFEARRDALLTLAARHRANPGVVVLSPGPRNETYFEHSFLARQWGFPLVEGADLIVRDRRVFLKTLAGLKPVDLILRRVDDSFCDPLEFRGDSLLGVPGLVEAVRNGAVIIDNALGSGLVETSALLGFLPGLCRELLGEELRLPSVATWWCGEDEARRYVRAHLDELVIKPAFRAYGKYPEFPGLMDAAAKNHLVERMEAHPEEFVAQEQVALSTAPVYTEDGFSPRHAVLRVYAAWNGQSYTVLPGGLTRVSTEPTSLMVSMQLGGLSKDTWVLGGGEETGYVLRAAPAPGDSRPPPGSIPSRVADNLFWLGRYIERVESRVRTVRALLPALSGEDDFGRGVSLETAVDVLQGLGYTPDEEPAEAFGEPRGFVQRILAEMIYDPSQTSGMRWNLQETRRVSWGLKEFLSADTWRVLQQLETQFADVAPFSSDQPYFAEMDLLDDVVLTLSAFAGQVVENTTRDPGWCFLEIGRRLERAVQTADLLRAGLVAAHTPMEAHLQLMLQIADSPITYRSRHPAALQINLVLELLVADESNPRSVGFQLAALLHQIDTLQEEERAFGERTERTLAANVLADVRSLNMAELSRAGAGGRLASLERVIETLKSELYELSDALTARYLSLSHRTHSRLASSW